MITSSEQVKVLYSLGNGTTNIELPDGRTVYVTKVHRGARVHFRYTVSDQSKLSYVEKNCIQRAIKNHIAATRRDLAELAAKRKNEAICEK